LSQNDWESLITSPILLQRLQSELPTIYQSGPSEIQSLAFSSVQQGRNVILGAETGTGKTLAYLLPWMNAVMEERSTADPSQWDAVQAYAKAVVLVPNKELVQQVVRMALPLAGGPAALVYDGKVLQEKDDDSLIRLAVLPGGMDEPNDYAPFRRCTKPLDLIVSTPAALGPWALNPKHVAFFADIQSLIVDEADMLLDGGYVRALEQVLMGFRRADRTIHSTEKRPTQYVFVAATLPDSGLRSVDAYLKKKFPTAEYITTANLHNAKHEGLLETQWIALESKQERMKAIVEMLSMHQQQQDTKGEKIMIFLNSVQDVENASAALQRAGISVLKYHAKLNLQERAETLEMFRQSTSMGQSSILVCTDLASRGLDVPDVTLVIHLQFATNVVTHLHRMGRCGRRNHSKKGRGIIFYSEQEEPLVKVVRQAEEQQEKMTLQQDVMEEPTDDFYAEENATQPSPSDLAKVQQAFSRKRGFTKKRKKLRRLEEEGEEQQQY
jgi:superfamily II DNA/RNA helicase